MLRTRLLAVMLALSGAGCAIDPDAVHTIAIDTAPKSGAACDVANSRGIWHLAATPGTVSIMRAGGELKVACRHPDGSAGQQTVRALPNAAMLDVAAAFGADNQVGDRLRSAAYDYPTQMMVVLEPGAVPALKPGTPKAGENLAKLPSTTASLALAPGPAARRLAPGVRLITDSGYLRIEAIDADNVVTVNSRSQRGRWHRGLIFVRAGSVSVSPAGGTLWPLEVGRSAVLVERRNHAGDTIDHQVKVEAAEDIAFEGRRVKVFRVVDHVRFDRGNPNRSEERHTNWYAPELGFLLRHRAEDAINGGVKFEWQAVRLEAPAAASR